MKALLLFLTKKTKFNWTWGYKIKQYQLGSNNMWHHVTTICVNIMWQLHVTTACDNNMCQHYVTTKWDNCMWQLHVTTACDNCMWQLHVTTACDNNMWQKLVTKTGHNILCQLHMTTACDNCMWQLPVTASCDNTMCQHYVTTKCDNNFFCHLKIDPIQYLLACSIKINLTTMQSDLLDQQDNITAHVRHQCRKTAVLSYHRCLIITVVEKIYSYLETSGGQSSNL